MKLAVFSHGKESGPDGEKIKILRKVAEANGFETVSLDYTKCENPNERIELLKKFIETKNAEFNVLVGSSLGGYVSTVVSGNFKVSGLFLLCPALYMSDKAYEIQNYLPLCDNIEIIHGWNDEIVPYENSVKFGKQTKAVLNLVDDGHRLKNSYHFIEKRFDELLKNIKYRQY